MRRVRAEGARANGTWTHGGGDAAVCVSVCVRCGGRHDGHARLYRLGGAGRKGRGATCRTIEAEASTCGGASTTADLGCGVR